MIIRKNWIWFSDVECIRPKVRKGMRNQKIIAMTTTTMTKIVLKCKQSFADTIENFACYFTWNFVECTYFGGREKGEKPNLYQIVEVWYFKLRFEQNAEKLQKCVCACLWSVKLCQCYATKAAAATASATEKPCNEGNQNHCLHHTVSMSVHFSCSLSVAHLLIYTHTHPIYIKCYLCCRF